MALRLIIALLAGVAFALLTQDWKSSPLQFIGTLAASSVISLLFLYFIYHQFLVPKPRPEFSETDSARLTTSITSSTRSAYAISSNWLDLWRTSTFRYYLHLDSTMSLVAYSSSLASPLDTLSDDSADKKEFIDYGWGLLDAIGAGRPPLQKHRVRLLIYPEWAYEQYSDEVNHLIRSHSAARIPCLPLVAERLYAKLDDDERQAVQQLVASLDQTALDKLPPVSRRHQLKLERAARKEQSPPWWPSTFPDMLLIDSSLSTGSVWWYSSSGRARDWDASDRHTLEATSVFELICRHAREAVWANYDFSSIGGVAVVVTPDRLESEAFFTRRYYGDWLQWIRKHAHEDQSAKALSQWLEAESQAMSNAVANYAEKTSDSGYQGGPLEILDVGCGFGRHLVDILRSHQDWRGIGIDINPSMVGDANRLAKKRNVHRQASFIVDDVADFESCADGEIDFAICMTNTLGNLTKEKQVALVRNLNRVLKPGGRAFVSAYSEGSAYARVHSYEEIGLDVELDEGKRMVVAAQGLESEAFSTTDLRRLLVDNGLRLIGGVEEAPPIGIYAVAERPVPAT